MDYIVHYIWLGGNEIPPNYLDNFNNCQELNSHYIFYKWRDREFNIIMEEHKLLNYANSLSFICKYNLFKYLLLNKFGGVYTDFDIKWKVSFSQLIGLYKPPYIDLLLTMMNDPNVVGNKLVNVLDDPFIISEKGVLGDCVNFCINRTQLRYDGDIYLREKRLEIYKSEPIGPFGLTEWIYKRNPKVSFFPQKNFLDSNGFYGQHEQKNNWKLV